MLYRAWIATDDVEGELEGDAPLPLTIGNEENEVFHQRIEFRTTPRLAAWFRGLSQVEKGNISLVVARCLANELRRIEAQAVGAAGRQTTVVSMAVEAVTQENARSVFDIPDPIITEEFIEYQGFPSISFYNATQPWYQTFSSVYATLPGAATISENTVFFVDGGERDNANIPIDLGNHVFPVLDACIQKVLRNARLRAFDASLGGALFFARDLTNAYPELLRPPPAPYGATTRFKQRRVEFEPNARLLANTIEMQIRAALQNQGLPQPPFGASTLDILRHLRALFQAEIEN